MAKAKYQSANVAEAAGITAETSKKMKEEAKMKAAK
jgi:hypothetical protein